MSARHLPGPAGISADDEVARLRLLREFGILDSPAEQDFDDLTALAARLCGMPVALVTILDADRVFFKSTWGTRGTQVSRENSFTHHTLSSSPGVLVVPDTAADDRFCDSPLVDVPGGIRFYAGAPLLMTADSVAVGVLCVLDTVPQEFGRQRTEDLAMVARQVVGVLELRWAAARLRAEIDATAAAQAEARSSRRLLDDVLAHTDVVVYAKDLDGRFLFANGALLRSMAPGSGAAIGRTAHELFSGAAADSFSDNDAAMVASGSWQVFAEKLDHPDGTLHHYRSTKFPLFDAAGAIYAIGGVSTDVTELTTLRAEMLESERRFRALFEYSPVGIGLSDDRGRWVQVNNAFGRFMGVAPEELIGRSAIEFAHPDDHPLIAQVENGQRTSPDGIGAAEIRFVQPEGPVRWGWVNITPIPGPGGERWTLAVVQDITERKEVDTELRRSQEELAAITAVARCVQSGADPRPVVVDLVRSLSGASVAGLLEPAGAENLLVTAWAGAQISTSGVADSGRGNAELVRRTGRPVLTSADAPGSTLWQPVVAEGDVIAVLEVRWDRLVDGDGDPAVRAVQVLAGEAGASLHAAQLRGELERSAATDPLTGALNRRAWNWHLQTLTGRAEQTGRPLTIALIDLDNFKVFNDTYGHAAGDELLRDFATDARMQLGTGGLFARWGGEEFIVALADCDVAHATALLERIANLVPGRQTCSIGHTIWRPGEPMATCNGRADAALYLAKAQGRDRVVAG